MGCLLFVPFVVVFACLRSSVSALGVFGYISAVWMRMCVCVRQCVRVWVTFDLLGWWVILRDPRRITFNPLIVLMTKAALVHTGEYDVSAHTHTCTHAWIVAPATCYITERDPRSVHAPMYGKSTNVCHQLGFSGLGGLKGWLIGLIRLLSTFVWTWLIQIHTPVPLSQTITLRPLLSILWSNNYRLERKIVHGCFCCWSLPGIALLLLLLLSLAVAVVGVGFCFSAVSGCRWQLWLWLCFSASAAAASVAVGAILDITVLCLGASLWQFQISQIPCCWCRCPQPFF